MNLDHLLHAVAFNAVMLMSQVVNPNGLVFPVSTFLEQLAG
jgi:hypothetical protein